MISRPSSWIPAGLLAVLVFLAPLPFGSITPGMRALLALALGISFSIGLAAAGDASLRALRPVTVSMLALLAVALVATLPFAGSPKDSAEGLSADSDGRSASIEQRVALESERTTALYWSALALALGAAAVAGHHRMGRRILTLSLLAAACFQVLYGAPRWMSRSSEIWGIATGAATRLRGTYINPDHLSLLLEIALALTVAGIWWGIRSARREPALEAKVVFVSIPVLAFLMLFVGLAFTGSRAGIAAALGATVAQGCMIALSRKRWKLAPVGAVVAIGGLGAVALIGFEEGLGRWLGTSTYEMTWNLRQEAYVATADLWRQAPVFGHGLGTFRYTFYGVATPELAAFDWDHAHNDWLELLATTGVVGAVLVGIGLVALLLRLNRVLHSGRHAEDRAVALAALGAMTAVALHSCLDFGLVIPANALALTVLCGAAAGTSMEEAFRGDSVGRVGRKLEAADFAKHGGKIRSIRRD